MLCQEVEKVEYSSTQALENSRNSRIQVIKNRTRKLTRRRGGLKTRRRKATLPIFARATRCSLRLCVLATLRFFLFAFNCGYLGVRGRSL